MIDVARARRETPGVAKVVHFNNAGAALVPAPVLDAMLDHLRLEAEIGGYEAANQEQPRVAHAYDAIAALLGCAADEVAVVENATRAWDLAFYSLGFKPGDRILTARAEYASNFIAFLQVAKRSGAVVEVVPSEDDGRLSTTALARMLDGESAQGGRAAGPVKLVAVTHVPTNGGLVNPAAEIGRLARGAGVPYLLDACQSVGQMPVDVEEIGCDMLSATGRKFLRGPRGIGFLYVRRALCERLEPPLLDLHSARWTAPDAYEIAAGAQRFETWEISIAAKIALGIAADYARAWGLPAIASRVCELAGATRAALADIPGVAVHDLGPDPCGIVSYTVAGMTPLDVKQAMLARGINVTTSRVGSTVLDMQARGLDAVVRASVHYYNDLDEVARFAAATAELARA